MNECNEWGIIYILDALSGYAPADARETESILERVSPRLSHQNPGVVLSASRVLMKYMDFLTNAEIVRGYCKRLTQPLIFLLSAEAEIQFVTLKNINLII
jgi:vesicle coat complex subunit